MTTPTPVKTETNKSDRVMATDVEAFYQAGRNWEAVMQLRVERSERRAWFIATIAVIVASVAILSLATLAPLKTSVPYVFALDRATGNVEVVSAADDRAVMGYQELLDKHWTQKYVIARESYFYRLLQTDYDSVLTMSVDDVAREYSKVYEGTNARDKKYGASMEIRVKVLSVTLNGDAVGLKATVRFEKAAKRAEADTAEPPQYYIATLSYEYRPSMKGQEKELIQNPLGFKVTSYRVDQEIGTMTPPTTLVSTTAQP